MRFIDFVNFA